MSKILVVEDETEIAESILDSLALANCVGEWASTKTEGLQRLLIYNYDMAILDWNLHRESGLDLCKEYRAQGGEIPILMLTGRNSVQDRVAGLDVGADDYMTKPFSVDELLARVRALLRRRSDGKIVSLKCGDLQLEPRRGVVLVRGEEVALRQLEVCLLEFLMRRPDQFFTANELLNYVWSAESDSTEAAVRKTINRLREKIDRGPDSYILNVKNSGYKIADSRRDYSKNSLRDENI